MSTITLLDNSLKLTIYYDNNDSEYEDNICLHFQEDCPEAERLFRIEDTSFYVTAEQAALIVLELSRVLEVARGDQANR
jgi:hypothetical protein